MNKINLPHHPQLQILSHLPYHDLLTVKLLSLYYRNLLTQHSTWQTLLRSHHLPDNGTTRQLHLRYMSLHKPSTVWLWTGQQEYVIHEPDILAVLPTTELETSITTLEIIVIITSKALIVYQLSPQPRQLLHFTLPERLQQVFPLQGALYFWNYGTMFSGTRIYVRTANHITKVLNINTANTTTILLTPVEHNPCYCHNDSYIDSNNNLVDNTGIIYHNVKKFYARDHGYHILTNTGECLFKQNYIIVPLATGVLDIFSTKHFSIIRGGYTVEKDLFAIPPTIIQVVERGNYQLDKLTEDHQLITTLPLVNRQLLAGKCIAQLVPSELACADSLIAICY